MELGFSWSKIAELFGVCRRTLYNVRCNFGMVGNNQTFTEISDRNILLLLNQTCQMLAINSGILKYGLPERIRTNMGGEVLHAATCMCNHCFCFTVGC